MSDSFTGEMGLNFLIPPEEASRKWTLKRGRAMYQDGRLLWIKEEGTPDPKDKRGLTGDLHLISSIVKYLVNGIAQKGEASVVTLTFHDGRVVSEKPQAVNLVDIDGVNF